MEQPLNFNWHYIRGFSSSYPAEIPSETEQINLPHNMVDFPFNHFRHSLVSGLGQSVQLAAAKRR